MTPYYDEAGITIYHGDCREVVANADLVDLPRTDVLITDPPFGVGFNGQWTKHTPPAGGYAGGVDDPEIGPEVVARALSLVQRGLVFSGNRQILAYPPPQDIGGLYMPSGSGFGPWGFCCWTPVLFYGKRPGSPNYPTVITSFDKAESNGHPCPKPLRWMRWAMTMGTLPGETVFDPFMGSGTTLVAAKERGNPAIGIEIEERYCEIAAKRLAQEVLDFG